MAPRWRRCPRHWSSGSALGLSWRATPPRLTEPPGMIFFISPLRAASLAASHVERGTAHHVPSSFPQGCVPVSFLCQCTCLCRRAEFHRFGPRHIFISGRVCSLCARRGCFERHVSSEAGNTQAQPRHSSKKTCCTRSTCVAIINCTLQRSAGCRYLASTS